MYCPWCQVKVSVVYSPGKGGRAACHMCGYPLDSKQYPAVLEGAEVGLISVDDEGEIIE